MSNDRPDGVGRNTARGTATFTTNLRVSRAFALGGQRTGGDSPADAVPVDGVDRVAEDSARADRAVAAADRVTVVAGAAKVMRRSTRAT